MASSIHPSHWNRQPPAPMRRVWIPKPGTAERRPLAILPMIDRCKQALVKLALEPEWETRFEAHSYGYRPGRSAHDAMAAIVVAIERHPCFVFDADIEKAFDHINQSVLLDRLQTYPALRQAIQTWLKAGIMDAGHYLPSETGIAQGGVLSPLLMNVALHGMEAVVTGNKAADQRLGQPLLVRYGDDFVILHSDLHELQQAAKRVRQWLATIGLQLNAQKTRITHTLTPYQGQIGFDFLGFSIRQELVEKFLREKYGQERVLRVKTIITPSQEAIKRHLAAIEQRLQQLQTASQERVIEELNPLIRGWASYYNGVVEAATMSRYDDLLKQRLISWTEKRHPGKAREWLLSRYWHRIGEHKCIFATPDGLQLRAYQQTQVLRG